MNFPRVALDPNGRPASILVTPDGKLVTSLAPRPAEVLPIQKASLVLDATNKVRLS